MPINVTLLFSREQYIGAAEAYLRGIERRIAAGLKPDVFSVASMFVSRWDVAVMSNTPAMLRDQLGIAIAGQTYEAYRLLLDSPRWQRTFSAGAPRQRLLWASTGTKDSNAPDILHVRALAAPSTVNTMPEATLQALADHGEVGLTCPCMPALATTYWPSSPLPASIPMSWPPNSSKRGPNRSSSPGRISLLALRRGVPSSRRLVDSATE